MDQDERDDDVSTIDAVISLVEDAKKKLDRDLTEMESGSEANRASDNLKDAISFLESYKVELEAKEFDDEEEDEESSEEEASDNDKSE